MKQEQEELTKLVDVADDSGAINELLLNDLLVMVDKLRAEMREGSIGVNQQQQLVQAIKLIRVLQTELEKSGGNTTITNLMKDLPFVD